MKPCKFAINLTNAMVPCGAPATTTVQLLPHYDTVMCGEHAAIFTEKDGWTKSPLVR